MSGGDGDIRRVLATLAKAVKAGKSGEAFLREVSSDLRGGDIGLFNCVLDVLRESVSVHDDGGERADGGGEDDIPPAPPVHDQTQDEHDASLRDIGECGEWRRPFISGNER